MDITVSVSTDAPSADVTIHVSGPTSRTVYTGGAVNGSASFTSNLAVPSGRYRMTATVHANGGPTLTTNPTTLEV